MSEGRLKKITVLAIDDDLGILRYLGSIFASEDFEFEKAATGKEGVAIAAAHPPDIVLLDLGLPDMDGLAVLNAIRSWSSMPVIVLSARGHEADKVAALDAGADDYLTKPFGAAELLARVRVAVRHSERLRSGIEESVFEYHGLRVDLSESRVTRDGADIHLTPTEYRLLAMLVKHAGKVITHRQLLTEICGPDRVDDVPYLRVYMAQLRAKLEMNPAKPRYLMTEPGVGYRLRAPDSVRPKS